MDGGWVITLPGIFFTVFLQIIGGVCEKGLPDHVYSFHFTFRVASAGIVYRACRI